MKPPSALPRPWSRRAAVAVFAAAAAFIATGAIAATATTNPAPHASPAPLPAVNLSVWLRHVDVQQPGSVTLSTQNQQRPLLASQQLRVRNGGRALFRMDQAIPLQWVTAASGFQSQSQGRQSGSTQIGSGPPPAGGSVSMNRSSEWRERSEGGGFQQQVTWLQTGQSLAVQPVWPGGNAPVDITIDLQQANAGPGTSTMTPRQNSVQVATSVLGAIGEWVTIAATGSAQAPGSYSSDAARNPPRALQVRITLD